MESKNNLMDFAYDNIFIYSEKFLYNLLATVTPKWFYQKSFVKFHRNPLTAWMTFS